MHYNCPVRNIVDILHPDSKNNDDGIHMQPLYKGKITSLSLIDKYDKYAIALGSSVIAGSCVAKEFSVQTLLSDKFDLPFVNLAYGGSTTSGDQQLFSKSYSSLLNNNPEFIYWHAGFNELFYLFQENEFSKLFGPSRQRFTVEEKVQGWSDTDIISRLNLNSRTGFKTTQLPWQKKLLKIFLLDLNQVYKKMSATNDLQEILNSIKPILNNIDFFELKIIEHVQKKSDHATIKKIIHEVSQIMSNSMRVVGQLAYSLDTKIIFHFQNIFQPKSFLNSNDLSADQVGASMLGIYKPWMLAQYDPARSLQSLLLRLTRLQMLSVYYPLLQRYILSSKIDHIAIYSSDHIDRSTNLSWRDEVHPDVGSQSELANYIYNIIKTNQ